MTDQVVERGFLLRCTGSFLWLHCMDRDSRALEVMTRMAEGGSNFSSGETM